MATVTWVKTLYYQYNYAGEEAIRTIIIILSLWFHILVPRAHDPSGQWQGSRALALSNTGSPRFTDYLSNLANLIGWEYETKTRRILRKSGPARALDPCHRPEGSWALGTRMMISVRLKLFLLNVILFCSFVINQLRSNDLYLALKKVGNIRATFWHRNVRIKRLWLFTITVLTG